MERLHQQLQFILELDKLKAVLRRSKLTKVDRQENSAEHSWHIALAAQVLAEYANEPVDISHVVKMLLIHDVVEIDAGDTFIYDDAGKSDQFAREKQAATRIFGLLPETQQTVFMDLWLEFEEQQSPEARFAKVMDRLMPLLHNYHNQGEGWQRHQIQPEQVLNINQVIEHGSTTLWDFAQSLIHDSVARGYFGDRSSN